jgi:hypothetical protein
MDKKYIELFKELARATAVAAEQVMDYDKEKKDDKGFDTAKMMRDDFEALHEKISAETFNGELTKAEYAKMLVGCYVIVGNLQDRIVALQKAVAGYQTDIVPKLSKIIEADTEEAAQTLAKELLVISEN